MVMIDEVDEHPLAPSKPRDSGLPVIPAGPQSALEISRAAVNMVWQSIQASHDNGQGFSASDLDALKKSLGELRLAEADYLELKRQADELIPRAEVQAAIQECVGVLVRLFDTLKTSLATEVSIWLADDKVRAMPDDERRRMVMDWAEHHGRILRKRETDTLREHLARARE